MRYLRVVSKNIDKDSWLIKIALKILEKYFKCLFNKIMKNLIFSFIDNYYSIRMLSY